MLSTTTSISVVLVIGFERVNAVLLALPLNTSTATEVKKEGGALPIYAITHQPQQKSSNEQS